VTCCILIVGCGSFACVICYVGYVTVGALFDCFCCYVRIRSVPGLRSLPLPSRLLLLVIVIVHFVSFAFICYSVLITVVDLDLFVAFC